VTEKLSLKLVTELANETGIERLFCAKALKACYGDKEQAKQWLELNGYKPTKKRT
jgi:translation elongation factor EF-Ts